MVSHYDAVEILCELHFVKLSQPRGRGRTAAPSESLARTEVGVPQHYLIGRRV